MTFSSLVSRELIALSIVSFIACADSGVWIIPSALTKSNPALQSNRYTLWLMIKKKRIEELSDLNY